MKRNYYLVMETLRPFLIMETSPLIELIFPASDVIEHLKDKLHTYRSRFDNLAHPMILFTFYEMLDSEHQLWFDEWFNKAMAIVEAKTTPHIPRYDDLSPADKVKYFEGKDVFDSLGDILKP